MLLLILFGKQTGLTALEKVISSVSKIATSKYEASPSNSG